MDSYLRTIVRAVDRTRVCADFSRTRRSHQQKTCYCRPSSYYTPYSLHSPSPLEPTFTQSIATLPAANRARTRSATPAVASSVPTSLTLPREASDHNVISPEMLANVDRQLMETILRTAESVATRNMLRDNRNSSGRELIKIICRTADNAPAPTGMAIESMMQAHFDGGLEEYSLRGFNSFYHVYDRFNRSLPAHQHLSEGVMSEKLSHVIRRIGENVGTLLDVKIALISATGRLTPTLTATRDVLTELEARELGAADGSKAGRAFLAKRNASTKTQDAKSIRKHGDPKRNDRANTFKKAYTPQSSTCLHCGGRHWHRDCPRKPKAAESKGSNGRALSAKDAHGTSITDGTGAALFAQVKGAAATFSVPSEGRALCTQDASSSHVSLSPLRRADPSSLHRSLSDLDVEAQDEAELAKAEMRDAQSTETSDSDYDPERPYVFWANYYLDDDDGSFDPERVEAQLEADNKAYS
eukprot:3405979-Pleurochrysis_carterae.AAC.2